VRGNVGQSAPIGDSIDTSAHLSAPRDALVVARLRAFLTPRLMGSLIVLTASPAYLAMRGELSLSEVLVSVVLFAAGLALAARSLTRASLWLAIAEEDRYRLLAHNMTDVIVHYGRNGSVLFVSSAVETLVGAKKPELLGQGLFNRVHVLDRPAYLTALADAAVYRENRSMDFRLRRDPSDTAAASPGEFIWIEMRCRPLDQASHDGDSEVVAVMRDTTERKNQEQELANVRAEAERANTAKGHFLATMSHELRTPLNAIIGFSEMLMEAQALMIRPEQRHEYAHLINESGRHLLAVVNGILDMSKIETGNLEIEPEAFAPGTVIEDSCDMLALKARKAGIELTLRIPKELPWIVADRRAVRQIVLNLVANAIKFSDRGGRVTVEARAQDDSIAVAVEDEGVGIGSEDLPRVGNPFFQARSSYDRRHDGTGLGLSIVKGLLALHRGDLEIHSRLGEGTRVTFHLPIDCEKGRDGKPVVERLVPRSAVEITNDRVQKSA
jgi:cell cycle sensor histidine kinase DivJ